MILEAETISSLVRDNLNSLPDRVLEFGTVHSRSARTVNVQYGEAGDGEWFVSIHPAGTAMHPYAVVLRRRGIRGDDMRVLGVSARDKVVLSREEICVAGGRMRVALRTARVWNAAIDPCGTVPAMRPEQMVRTLLGSLMTVGTRSPFLDGTRGEGAVDRALIRRCHEISLGLWLAWRDEDSERITRVMMSAVGLGGGSTPSGDDFLMGFLGAARFFGNRPLAAHFHVQRSSTTLPSYFMLNGALAGFLPGPLSCLLHATAAGKPDEIHRSVQLLARLGATSGQDMLAGVICYLEATVQAGEVQKVPE